MTDFSKLTPEQLEKMDKDVLITIIVSLQSQLNSISTQLNYLTEQIALMNQRTFGRKTEKADQVPHQMTLDELYHDNIFNEPEVHSDDSPEPEVDEVIISSYTRKKKTTREEKLEGLPARVIQHTIDKDKLAELFPDGYKELPEEVYKRLYIIPQTFIVDEHHVHVYVSKKNDGTIVKADRPADLFRNSLATPALVAAIMAGKYVNHLPLERQSSYFRNFNVNLETNTLANWMIKASDKYLSKVYDKLHKYLYDSHVIHADETPFKVINDGRDTMSNSYMWVYRNGACSDSRPIILFDYQPTRKTEHPEEFLKDYSGIVVTDGYQVYHSLEKKRDNLKVGGCWIHAKRGFSEIIKAIGNDKPDYLIAEAAAKRISEISHLDNQLDDLTKIERKNQRRTVIKPKVDAFFTWVKSVLPKVPGDSVTAKALKYCINQEQFLRVFLDDASVPMDNNRAEQAIRPFTLGRKNWVNMFSKDGAHASAVIYSIVETARANGLNVNSYLEYLLANLSIHANDPTDDYIVQLLPWSKEVKKLCTKPQNFQNLISKC